MNTLNLTLKRKWFDMIAVGEKTEEYREIKPYWTTRLLSFEEEMEFQVFDEMLGDMTDPNHRHAGIDDLMKFFGVKFRQFDNIKFRNGYAKDAPAFYRNLKGITVSTGRAELGAEPGKFYFVLMM